MKDSQRHKITALSACDDKVYICDNNVDTFNFGHYKIRKNIISEL